MNRLIEIIESLRRKHHFHVEDDCWFSCPADEDYCGTREPVCECGFVEHNAKVDEALLIIKRKFEDE